MMLTEDEIAFIRDWYKDQSDGDIVNAIGGFKQKIEDGTRRIGTWRETIKVMETILDERTP